MDMMTPKHAKPQPAARFSWDPPEDAYEKDRIKELEGQLAFANETISNLQKQCGRMSKWASEIEANAKDMLAEKDERIAQLEKALIETTIRTYQEV